MDRDASLNIDDWLEETPVLTNKHLKAAKKRAERTARQKELRKAQRDEPEKQTGSLAEPLHDSVTDKEAIPDETLPDSGPEPTHQQLEPNIDQSLGPSLESDYSHIDVVTLGWKHVQAEKHRRNSMPPGGFGGHFDPSARRGSFAPNVTIPNYYRLPDAKNDEGDDRSSVDERSMNTGTE